MNLLDGLEKLINEHGSSVILKERIALANDKFSALEREKDQLELEKNALTSKLAELRNELKQKEDKIQQLKQRLSSLQQTTIDFIDIRGVKIKKLANGALEENTVYCFHCLSPLSAKNRVATLSCSKCGYESSIQNRHLSCVISEAKGEDTPDWWKKF